MPFVSQIFVFFTEKALFEQSPVTQASINAMCDGFLTETGTFF